MHGMPHQGRLLAHMGGQRLYQGRPRRQSLRVVLTDWQKRKLNHNGNEKDKRRKAKRMAGLPCQVENPAARKAFKGGPMVLG